VLDPSQLRQFESEGFLLVPGLLDPKAEIAALDAAYQDLIRRSPSSISRRPGCRRRRASATAARRRFALMQGASGRAVGTSTPWERLPPRVPAPQRLPGTVTALPADRSERCSTLWSPCSVPRSTCLRSIT
jgi:hypothetical protein